jgi:hypothetical protein
LYISLKQCACTGKGREVIDHEDNILLFITGLSDPENLE